MLTLNFARACRSQETDSQSDPDDDEEEKEDTDDVAMVPMADMLNARFETDNVCTRLIFMPWSRKRVLIVSDRLDYSMSNRRSP